jgi:citrate lyase subunit beta-like protein
VVPKVDSPSDLTFISNVITHSRPKENHNSNNPISILALIESARSLTSLSQITAVTPHRLSGLIFALNLSLTRTPDLKEFLFARR